MITIKSPEDIAKMREAGRVVAQTLDMLSGMIQAGITTGELDKAAEAFIRSKGAVPSFLNYRGYPASVCISVNEQVVHGIPGRRVLHTGDIVSLDVGAYLNGYHGDAARTVIVGSASKEAMRLIEVTRECFFKGLEFAREGYHISDISRAIQQHAEAAGYGVVRDLVGHGIGREMHEEPEVPNFEDRRHGRGPRLMAGMTLAIEPMINMGTGGVAQLNDGWTVVTLDGKLSAHYENTIAVTHGEPLILTAL